MAWYRDGEVVKRAASKSHWTAVLSIGDKPEYPGIYKCQHCGFEDVINRACEKLPPCSNCAKPGHSNTWKLLVRAEDN